MYNTPQINFKVVEKNDFEGVFEISPLIKGFGHTVGSALRRTLYSSTKGAAITKVSIEGVPHQFTTIEGAKDDVLQILLSLKQIVIKKEVEGPVELELEVKGPGDVKAGDIEVTDGIEIINKDFVITSLANSKSNIKAKLTVESGYGYVEVDESVPTPIGTVLLDAAYSPIINVQVSVEPTRVGKNTNFDKLTLSVRTDGSVGVEDAVRNAAKVLKEFFYKIQTGEDYMKEEEEKLAAQAESKSSGVGPSSIPADEVALEELRFPTRTINALRKAGIKTLGDLAAKSEDELLKIRNLGEKSIREIVALLEEEGLR